MKRPLMMTVKSYSDKHSKRLVRLAGREPDDAWMTMDGVVLCWMFHRYNEATEAFARVARDRTSYAKLES